MGRSPMAQSSIHRDLINFQKPVEMSEKDIHSLIRAFALAAQRAMEVGADVVKCISCNKCFAGSRNGLPVLCYEKGLPQNK
ncbi:hypothetical protein QUF76_15580 [Desulfobacterales bacterium HSG16]|nr:hypothetical protein [Desulfobacterales bacterium HSG16]